jgi:NitT/TauT family transport system permease protein
MKQQNYSPSHLKFLSNHKFTKILILSLQFFLLIALIAMWELLTKHNIIDSFIFSSPSRILKTIKQLYENKELFLHIRVTLFEVLIGFFVSTFLGVLIAIILWWNNTLKRILDPYLVVLNSLPKVALGPIIIIWFGANTQAIIAMAVLITIIITILNMLNAFINVDNDKILLLKSMGATKTQILFKLILPASLVKFINTLKINVGLTWVGVIMGEHLVSRAGLGYQILYGSLYRKKT